MPIFHAGLDWSGRASLASRQPDIFIACLVAIEDVDTLKSRFDALRLETFGESDAELHGYKMRPERIAAALQIGIDLDAKIAALCIDKTVSTRAGTLPPVGELHGLSALRVWSDLLGQISVARLVYDTELEGKKRQKAFETEIKRCSAALYPARKLKVKPLPSHQSDLIQLADVVAYALSRELRGEKVEPEIRKLLREIKRRNPAVGQSAAIW